MILDQFKLDDKVAIVTGSAQGLGQGIALGLAEAGADVALVQHVRDASETRKRIEELGRRCVTIRADLSDKGCVPRIVDTTVKELGGMDILFYNAGSTVGVINIEPAVPGINCLGFKHNCTKILCQCRAQLIDLVMFGGKNGPAVIINTAGEVWGSIDAVVKKAGYIPAGFQHGEP